MEVNTTTIADTLFRSVGLAEEANPPRSTSRCNVLNDEKLIDDIAVKVSEAL